ncbi:hypothetical protein WJX84_002541 [Apatococcus fuscideae]|uniref:Uncharacterized protein n=1 Tax=Apatococcus fuscideae TaxID=2026836 RepID=A0AAW1TCJ6_9CHLO
MSCQLQLLSGSSGRISGPRLKKPSRRLQNRPAIKAFAKYRWSAGEHSSKPGRRAQRLTSMQDASRIVSSQDRSQRADVERSAPPPDAEPDAFSSPAAAMTGPEGRRRYGKRSPRANHSTIKGAPLFRNLQGGSADAVQQSSSRQRQPDGDWGWDSPAGETRAGPSQRPARDGQAAASSSNASSMGSGRGSAGRPVPTQMDPSTQQPRSSNGRKWWQGFGSQKRSASAFGRETRPGDEAVQEPGSEEDIWESPDDWEPTEAAAAPDITRLEPAELDLLMPVVPSVPQLQITSGGPVTLLQRCAGSVLGTLVFYKVVLLASASLTFPLWSPVLLAAARNWDVKKSCRFVGLWRTAVMDISVNKGRRRINTPGSAMGPAIKLLMGDASGLRSSISLPYIEQYEQIQVGDAAEMLVTSARKDFSTFKALKEVYLPETGIWLSEYPLTDRQTFLDISLSVEDDRQQSAATA